MAKSLRTKKTSKVARKPRYQPPAWGYLVIGLLVGLGIGLVAYLYKTGLDRPAPPGTMIKPPEVEKPQSNPDKPQQQTKSQYDFYTLLPEMEVVIPEIDELGGSNQGVKAGTSETYVLQAGSFRRFDEADGLKANLALIGIKAIIQTVAVNGENTWYRVRIGPYNNIGQLRQVRSRLKQNNIDYIVLKMKPGDL